MARQGGSLPPTDTPASFSGRKPKDRSNSAHHASSAGAGGIGGAGWGRHHSLGGGPTDTDIARSASVTFGVDRRYSGGTIGIASMLGSSGPVRSGRTMDDFLDGGGFDRRVSSVLSGPGTPPDITAFGSSVAGGMPIRQSSAGAGTGVGSAAQMRGVRYQRSSSVRMSGPRSRVDGGEGGGIVFELGESVRVKCPGPVNTEAKEVFKRNDVEALPE